MSQAGIGDAVLRKEDDQLIKGEGCYIDDLDIPAAAHAVFVRSPHAHARIVSIDVSRAQAFPGVLAVFTGVDIRDLKPILYPVGSSREGADVPLANRNGGERVATPRQLLPVDRARFVGEAVAMVVAEALAIAKDAANAITIEWNALPAVTLASEATCEGAPRLWDHVPDNLALDAVIGDPQTTNAAFVQAAFRIELETHVQRVTGVHLEPRAVLASYDTQAGVYTELASRI